jgi:biopolymer transport protein ExbB
MKRNRFFNTIMGIGLGCMLASSSAHAWWNGEWTIRKKVVIDASDKGASISEPIGTTPVLIRLFDGNFQFQNAKEDGSDLRFVAADDKTPLKFHIEKWDGLMGEAFVWVNVPDVKPGAATSFWIYYGNTGPKAVKIDDLKGTYDADTALVYHFGESGQPASDASGNNNTAQNAGVAVAGSMIGGGVRLGGATPITIPASPALVWSEGGALTWSAWVKLNALKPNAVIASRRDTASGKGVVIGADNGVPYVEVISGGAAKRSTGGTAVAPASWHHLAVVANAGKITLYLDGESYGSVDAALPALNTALLLGGDTAPGDVVSTENSISGELDELAIAKVARPIGYIKTAALGQGGEKASKLLTFNPDEANKSWLSGLSEGYFGIIVKSLTFDGWVVIGLLMIMAAISWYIMVTKAKYLNAAAKGNALFMAEWRHVAADLTVLDDLDHDKVKALGGRMNAEAQAALAGSTVYRIYHIGAEEIRHRIAADKSPGGKQLKARSIQAIRAALDTGLIHEMHKLNGGMVMLTIAISGGPFLGLLGTVVGVMITFAAVAAAGDVNVNAIAPGIAAALLATVAGLAVAIPALFGYNYLLTRVKDATSDMQVFIDEFISKMAEFYGGKVDQVH